MKIHDPYEESLSDEPLRGAARYSRHEGSFRPNANGVKRTLEEAIEIGARNGIAFDPAEYKLIVDPVLRADYANYFDLAHAVAGSIVPWRRITAGDGRIVIRVQRHTLTSDEAIVAVLAHELHETQALQEEFARSGGSMPVERLRRLVESSGESLHNAAWDYADELLDRIRAEGRTP